MYQNRVGIHHGAPAAVARAASDGLALDGERLVAGGVRVPPLEVDPAVLGAALRGPVHEVVGQQLAGAVPVALGHRVDERPGGALGRPEVGAAPGQADGGGEDEAQPQRGPDAGGAGGVDGHRAPLRACAPSLSSPAPVRSPRGRDENRSL